MLTTIALSHAIRVKEASGARASWPTTTDLQSLAQTGETQSKCAQDYIKLCELLGQDVNEDELENKNDNCSEGDDKEEKEKYDKAKEERQKECKEGWQKNIDNKAQNLEEENCKPEEWEKFKKNTEENYPKCKMPKRKTKYDPNEPCTDSHKKKINNQAKKLEKENVREWEWENFEKSYKKIPELRNSKKRETL